MGSNTNYKQIKKINIMVYIIVMSLYLCSLLMIQTLYTHRISWLPLSLGGVWRGPLPVPGLGRRRGRAHVEARVAAVARRLLGAAVAVPSTGVWGWLLVSGRIGTNGFNPTMCWILNFTPICSPGKWDDTLRILIDEDRNSFRLTHQLSIFSMEMD